MLNKTLEGAAKGSLALVNLLLERFQSSPALLTPNVVKVLFSHLHASKVPSFDSSPPSSTFTGTEAEVVIFHSQNIERARTVLWGFKDFDKICFTLGVGCRALTPVLLSSWFGVYRWIEYFFQAIIEEDLGDDNFKLSFVEASIHLFAFFSYFDGIPDLLAETPGAMKLLTQLWLQHHKYPKSNPYASTILLTYIRTEKKHYGIDEMTDAFDGSATALVKEILEPYRHFQSSPSAILEDRILSMLPIFNHFVERPKHKLCRELLINNGVRELIQSYLRCVTNPISSQSHKYIVQAPGVCFEFFGELWRCTPGYAWVVQAFRAGLLELFVRCWAFLSPLCDGDNETVNDGFLDFSMRYLAVLPVLQAASTAIREVNRNLDMETRIKLAPPKSADAWCKFESSVKDLERTAESLIESRLEKYESICDFVSRGYTYINQRME